MFHKMLKIMAISAVFATGVHLVAEEEFLLGGCAHFSKSRADINATLDMFAECGLSATRDDIVWQGWEKEQGKYIPQGYYEAYIDRAIFLGLRPIQLINYGHTLYDPSGVLLYENPNPPSEAFDAFGRFCGWIATRYQGKSKQPALYQVWNEWPGAAAPYVKALAAAYPQMKKADPDCIVIANSCHKGEAFLEETFKLGALKNCDGISWHAYNHGELGSRRTPEAFFARVQGILELSKKYNDGNPKPLYLTEIGRPNHVGLSGCTEAETGDYLTRLLLMFRTEPAIKGAWIYNFANSGYDPEDQEDNFGLCHADLTPKESFYAVRSIAELIRCGIFVRRWKTPNDIWLLQFRMPDGRDVLAAWSTTIGMKKQLIFTRGDAPDTPLTLLVAGGTPIERKWGWLEWVDATDNKMLGLGGRHQDEFSIIAGSRPVLLSGKLEGVSLKNIKQIKYPVAKVQTGVKIPNTVIWADNSLKHAKKHSFGSELLYRRLSTTPRNGLKDLDASFRVAIDGKELHLEVTVTDDIHSNNFHGSSLWNGDSVQVAFSALNRQENGPAGTEYALALTTDGPEVFREASQLELSMPTEAKLDVKRNGTKTIYTFTVPLSELGVESKAGMPMGLSLVVNDNDGGERKGYLHWADGVANGKNPEQYNWVIMQ